MSSQEDIRSLLKQGVDAAKAGDRDEAREYFERVIEIDENNEQAWLFMYRIAESDEERRIYLGNVLYINPDNEKAQALLDRLDGAVRAKAQEDELVPGVPRRLAILIGGGILGVFLIVLAVILIFGGQQAARERAEVAAATNAVNTSVALAQAQTSDAIAAATGTAETLALTASPTPEGVSGAPTLPPTWTAIPTVDTSADSAASEALFPPPTGLSGLMVGWGALDRLNVGYFPALRFPLDQPGTIEEVGDALVDSIDIDPAGGSSVVYTRYFPATFDFGLELANINGGQSQLLSQSWQGQAVNFRQQQARYSDDGTRIVFVATSDDTLTSEVYVLNLTVPQGVSPITRLTNDEADYFAPDISPDNARVVAVKVDSTALESAEDLVIIDAAARTQQNLTSDGADFIESFPVWSPDGTQIAYAASPGTADAPAEIILLGTAGGAVPVLPVRSDQDDILPVFSPDGNHLAFTSNRNGQYNIYILDRNSNEIFQLTNVSEDPVFGGGWWQPGIVPPRSEEELLPTPVVES